MVYSMLSHIIFCAKGLEAVLPPAFMSTSCYFLPEIWVGKNQRPVFQAAPIQAIVLKGLFTPSDLLDGLGTGLTPPLHQGYATQGRVWSKGKQKCHRISCHFKCGFSGLDVCLLPVYLWLVSRPPSEIKRLAPPSLPVC